MFTNVSPTFIDDEELLLYTNILCGYRFKSDFEKSKRRSPLLGNHCNGEAPKKVDEGFKLSCQVINSAD